MKIYKNYVKMQEESMSKYLEKTVVNSVGWISWNLQLKVRAQMEDLFQCRFSHWIDPYVPISGIMSKLAYRLGFTTACILHDLMTISPCP